MRALANHHHRSRPNQPPRQVEIEIYEPLRPAEVTIVHLTLWYGKRDLWVYRAAGGEIRTVTPMKGVPTPLPDRAWQGWPPVGPVLAAEGV